MTLGPSTSRFSNNNIYPANIQKTSQTNLSKPSTIFYSTSLEDQIWYHGLIKRVEAQTLLKNEGDFLVRASISNSNGFVLSGKNQGGQIIHFEINQTNDNETNELLYHFEDEKFASIVSLIEFYLGHSKQITSASRFVLKTPIPRKQHKTIECGFFFRNAFPDTQKELEVAYASYLDNNKSNSLNKYVQKQQKSLGQRAILNQTKRRFGTDNSCKNNSTGDCFGSEYDIRSIKDLESGRIISAKSVASSLDALCNSNNKEGDLLSIMQLPKPPSTTVPEPPPTKNTMEFLKQPKNFQLNKSAGSSSDEDYSEMDYAAMDALRMTSKNEPLQEPQLIRGERISSPNSSTYSVALKNAEIQNFILQSANNSKSSSNLLLKESNNSDLEKNNSFVDLDPLMRLTDRAQSCHNLLMRKAPHSFKRISGENFQEENFEKFDAQRIQPAPMLPARSTTNLLVQTKKNFVACRFESDYSTLPNPTGHPKTNEDEKDYSNCNLNSQGYPNDEDYSLLSNLCTRINNTSSSSSSIIPTSKNTSNNSKEDSVYSNFEEIKSLDKTLKNITNKKEYCIFSKNDYGTLQKPICSNKITERPLLPPKPNLFKQIPSPKSKYFNPENVKIELIGGLQEILLKTDPRQLAIWISEEDCKCFYPKNFLKKGPSTQHNIFKQYLNNEIFERAELLKGVILATIYSNYKFKNEYSKGILEIWIQTAKILLFEIGNAFSFANICTILKQETKENAKLLEILSVPIRITLLNHLYPGLDHLNGNFCKSNKADSEIDILLPFIPSNLEFLLLNPDYSNDPKLLKSLQNFEGNFNERFDLLWDFIRIAKSMLCSKNRTEFKMKEFIKSISMEADENNNNNSEEESWKNPFVNKNLQIILNIKNNI